MSDIYGVRCPCEDCILRSEVCHTTCLHYKAFQHAHRHAAEMCRQERMGDREANARLHDAVVHWKKIDSWRKR